MKRPPANGEQSGMTLAALALVACLAQPESPLAGPRVVNPPAMPRLSITQRVFDGTVKMPEVSPEEAALEQLKLDGPEASESQRESHTRARAVLAARARFMDEFVLGNIPLLTMFGNAENTGDGLDQFMLALEAVRKFKPLTDKGRLADLIAAELSTEDRARYNRVLAEFWSDLARDRAQHRKPDGKRPGRVEVILGAKLESFGREVERSFTRVQYSGELLYQYATKGMRLTKNQERRLRELVGEHAAKGEEVTEEDNKRLFAGAWIILEPRQRGRLVRNLKGL